MQGLVTDVAIKRKIRNMVTLLGESKPGYDIYVEAGVALNAQHERAYAALGLQPGTAKAADQDQARQWFRCYYGVTPGAYRTAVRDVSLLVGGL